MTRYRLSAAISKVLLPAWLCALAAGFGVLEHYASTPEVQGRAPERWLPASGVPRGADRWTLLIFIHPYCPCSRATLEELSQITARCGDRLEAHVLFVLPPEEQADCQRQELWRAAAAMPGVRLRLDLDGVEASRFGARTSGQGLLFDPEGTRRFAGGITISRGHAGANPGEDAIVSWVCHGRAEVAEAPTFGCALPIRVNLPNSMELEAEKVP